MKATATWEELPGTPSPCSAPLALQTTLSQCRRGRAGAAGVDAHQSEGRLAPHAVRGPVTALSRFYQPDCCSNRRCQPLCATPA